MTNPCSIQAPANTAACEALASQIENFTLNFFGEVFKTEVNGAVQWSLPGRLDVGLVLNPRNVGEPLGCYFLRLFRDGIVGAPGEKGDPGLPGCNGSTPYVQVLAGFSQPALNVTFSVKVSRNPSILPGMDVFIDGSGWYEIITSDGLGNVTLALRKAVVNPLKAVAVGTVLLPSGKVGGVGGQGIPGIQGIKGPVGVVGPIGDAGPQGVAAPATKVTLATYQATIPTFALLNPPQVPGEPPVFKEDGYMGSVSFAGFQDVVLFPGAVPCTIVLPKPGTYILMGRMGYGVQPLSFNNGGQPVIWAASYPGVNKFRYINKSTNTVVPQSTMTAYFNNRSIAFVSTTTPNNVIQVQTQAVVGAAVIAVHYFLALKIS